MLKSNSVLLQRICRIMILASLICSMVQPAVGFLHHHHHHHRVDIASTVPTTASSTLSLSLSDHMNHLVSSSEATSSTASIFTSSHSLLLLSIENNNDKPDIAFEDAFNDNINFFNDSTIQLLFAGFSILVLLAIIAKSLFNQMDNAIQKVLVDFETVMQKEKYKQKWMDIQTELDGLDELERSVKLFEIMEQLQRDEPQFMEKVNNDMMKL